ncbi:hypothetical protein V500_06153 [Pseudogymnoascus sp. VKM F-4518 (FW-2643)]|nr:hypothetical protein V500_06153 [Pseudogymnoascus sp. VKM F-4518 (FW-2643)]
MHFLKTSIVLLAIPVGFASAWGRLGTTHRELDCGDTAGGGVIFEAACDNTKTIGIKSIKVDDGVTCLFYTVERCDDRDGNVVHLAEGCHNLSEFKDPLSFVCTPSFGDLK